VTEPQSPDTEPTVEAALRDAAAEISRKRAENAPAGEVPHGSQDEPLSIAGTTSSCARRLRRSRTILVSPTSASGP
jgi:hypothetical protein